MQRDRPLEGQVAVVTGGNSGIGLGMARGLVAAGAAVALWGRREEQNSAAAESILTADPTARVETMRCDVADPEQVEAATAATVERLGRLDACVVNAGTSGIGSLLDLDLSEWRRLMAVNLDGAFSTMQSAARRMVDQGEGGAIVVISSTSAVHGAPMNPHYAASKTALLGLTRSAAVGLARHRIRVNAVLPGWTLTDMARAGYENERFREVTTNRTPARRWADPDEFGALAVYLCDKRHTFHTGDTVTMDGGYTVF